MESRYQTIDLSGPNLSLFMIETKSDHFLVSFQEELKKFNLDS